MSNRGTALRREMVAKLLEAKAPAPELLQNLAEFGWDANEELVQLERGHVKTVLQRFAAGEMTARDVEAWANALEGRDDVGVSDGVAAIVFKLANPELEGPLTLDKAHELIRCLS